MQFVADLIKWHVYYIYIPKQNLQYRYIFFWIYCAKYNMSTFLSFMIQKLKVKDYMHTAHKEWYPPTFSIIHYIFLCILTFKSASFYNICLLQLPVQSPVICFLRFGWIKKYELEEKSQCRTKWMEDLSKYNAPVLVIWGLQNSDSNQRISLDTRFQEHVWSQICSSSFMLIKQLN